MAESSVHTSSFKRFLKTVGIDSDSAGERSASLPSKASTSASTFYSYSSEDLTGSRVPSKCGWLLKQCRGVLRSWQDKWFVLSGNYLVQYSSDDETQSPQSVLFLKNHSVKELASTDILSDDSQKFMFEISPSADGSNSSQETVVLATKSPEERRAWIQLLRQVLYKDAGGGIFGQSLEDTLKYELERDPDRKVPEIVQICVEFLCENGLEVGGLFRLPGRVSVVRRLREAFDVGGSRPSLDDVDVHSVASLLKSYLCDLPQPIIPVAHYDRVMHIVTRERPLDPQAAITALSDALRQLPHANYSLLHYLCDFLHNVARYSEVNRMTASNLAMVFSPCFIKPEIDDPALLAGTAVNRATAVQDMIEQFSHVFPANAANECDIPPLVDVTADVNKQETHCLLNGSVTRTPVDVLTDAGHGAGYEETSEASDLIKLQSNTVNSSDSMLCRVSEPVTESDCDLQLKIVQLQQQLQAEMCCVAQLRQQLAAERLEAAKQAELLAKRLDEERTATSNAVMRVVELQTQLNQYSMKFGPLH